MSSELGGQHIAEDEYLLTEDISAEEFIDTYYKKSRIHSPDQRKRLIVDRKIDLIKLGNTLISHHDSVNGKVMWLYKS